MFSRRRVVLRMTRLRCPVCIIAKINPVAVRAITVGASLCAFPSDTCSLNKTGTINKHVPEKELPPCATKFEWNKVFFAFKLLPCLLWCFHGAFISVLRGLFFVIDTWNNSPCIKQCEKNRGNMYVFQIFFELHTLFRN